METPGNEVSQFVATLARDLVLIDSRSTVSNLPIADRLESELSEFQIERIDYKDPAGVNKCVLVAARGSGGLAFCGHMDTVPNTGWTTDPWSGQIDGDILHGLGSTDMKGPLASLVAAATTLPANIPIALFITTDEETTKQGASLLARTSELARAFQPRGILIAEPTRMIPVRGHRSHIEFIAVATGRQAHSSTGIGRNANWLLIPFLNDMAALFHRLLTDPALQDPGYDPAFSDFNPLIDNHDAAINITVPKATVRIRYRYSAAIDPTTVIDAVQAAADRHGLTLAILRAAPPPELPATHPLVALAATLTGVAAMTVPFGTDASELQSLAPCLILGPGNIANAHTPGESVSLAALVDAVPIFTRLAEAVAS